MLITNVLSITIPMELQLFFVATYIPKNREHVETIPSIDHITSDDNR